MVILGGGFAFQRTLQRTPVESLTINDQIQFLNSRPYAGPVVLYALYGAFDAIWQTYSYWLMGALTNNTHMSDQYSGFYKAIQNAGAAFAGQVNAKKTASLTASHQLGPVDSRHHVCNPYCMISAGNPAS